MLGTDRCFWFKNRSIFIYQPEVLNYFLLFLFNKLQSFSFVNRFECVFDKFFFLFKHLCGQDIYYYVQSIGLLFQFCYLNWYYVMLYSMYMTDEHIAFQLLKYIKPWWYARGNLFSKILNVTVYYNHIFLAKIKPTLWVLTGKC